MIADCQDGNIESVRKLVDVYGENLANFLFYSFSCGMSLWTFSTGTIPKRERCKHQLS